MLLKKETASKQRQLANYCRSGYYDPIPEVNPKRAKVYRRLVYNILEGTLSKAYPITRQILIDQEWYQLIADFHIQHNSQSPYLWSMPKGLWEFAIKTDYANRLDKPYLSDLLCFEWLEIEMDMMQDIPIEPYEKEGDVLESPLLLNPHHRIQTFNYPVFSKSLTDIEKHKGQYHLLLFRHQKNYQVRYITLSPLHVAFLSILQAQSINTRLALESVTNYFNLIDQANLLAESQKFIKVLLDEGAVLGYLPKKNPYYLLK